jgi:hypothetical protein
MKRYSIMKRFYQYLILVFLCFWMPDQVIGQVVTVSEEIYLKNDYSYDILGKLNDQILLFRDKGNKVEIHAFDEDLHFKWDRTINFEKNRVDIITVLADGDFFNVFYGYRSKGDYILMHKRFDGAVNVVDTSVVVVYENQYFNPRFLASRSEDRSKVLLFRGDKDSEMDVFSYDLSQDTVLWDRKLKFRNVYLKRDFRKMVVSNEGDMFMVLENNRLLKKNYFELFKIDRYSGELYKKKIDLEENTAIDIFTEYDNMNQRLVISGMYADKNLTRANGIFFAPIDWAQEGQKMQYVNFSNELIEDVYGKQVNKNKGLTNFSIEHMILRQDGGVVVIAEMNKEFSRRSNVPVRRDYMRSGWVDYYFEDLLVYSIHPNGEEHWNTVLKKRQYSQDDDAVYSSFFLFKTPQDLRLLYNDEIRQENTVSEYVLKGNGKNERNSVFSTDYQRLRLRFRDGVQIAYNECIVPSERNNRLNLVRIRYN